MIELSQWNNFFQLCKYINTDKQSQDGTILQDI